MHSPGLALSAGGWLGVQLSKAGGRGGFIVLTLLVVMTVNFN